MEPCRRPLALAPRDSLTVKSSAECLPLRPR